MTDDIIEVPDSVDDISKWKRYPCPCCGQIAEMRWTGLRAVAATGDENHAEKQWRPPAFTSPDDGPFIVQEDVGLPGDVVMFCAIDPSTGITSGCGKNRGSVESDMRVLNAAYWLGRSHESHVAGAIVLAARAVQESRDDTGCGDFAHSSHVDTNAAIALADAIETYDGKGGAKNAG